MSTSKLNWWRALVALTAFLILYGLAMVLLPLATSQGFSLMIYGERSHLASFGPDALAYIQLVHAVLGAALVGWGAVLMGLVLGPLRRGSAQAWSLFVLSLLVWFIPDTAYSIVSGFWQNAVLNSVFMMGFALPLVALRPKAWIQDLSST